MAGTCNFIPHIIWGMLCQRQISKAVTIKYIPQYLRDVTLLIGSWKCAGCLIASSWKTRVSWSHLEWGLLNQFPLFRYFLGFHYCRNTGCLLHITFIFDKCHRSSAATTPVKYERDSYNLTGIFSRSKISLTGKLANGVLVTSTSGQYHCCWWHHGGSNGQGISIHDKILWLPEYPDCNTRIVH